MKIQGDIGIERPNTPLGGWTCFQKEVIPEGRCMEQVGVRMKILLMKKLQSNDKEAQKGPKIQLKQVQGCTERTWLRDGSARAL